MSSLAFSQASPKPWTVLVYWAVDNDLYEYSKPFLKSFEKVSSEQNINIVVHYDYPNGKPTERQLITPNQTTTIQILPENLNSADPKTLTQFINWGMTVFPSTHTSLVIGSHGSNWSGVIQDDGTKQYMNLKDFRVAVEKAHLDLILFDTCKMSFLETLYALQNTAQFMVGSPLDVNGFDHELPLGALASKPSMSPDELARRYVYAYPGKLENRNQAGIVASSFQLNANYTALAKAADSVFKLVNVRSLDAKKSLYQSLARSQNEDLDIALDLYELIEKSGALSPELRSKAQSFVQSFPKNKWIQASAASYESGFHSGLAITCATKIEDYRTTGLGSIMPEWSALCATWVKEFSGGRSK